MSDTVISQDILNQLQQAVRDGDWGTVAQAIENDVQIISATDADGVTLLHLAAGVGNEFITARLLEFDDCPLDTQNHLNSRTALHYAANKNRLPVINLLLAAGANAHLLDNTGLRPLDMASTKETKEALHTITLTPIICLRSAISEGAGARVRRLLAALPKLLSVTDSRGNSLLCQAIELGNQPMLAELLAAGVPITLADNDGQGPLSKAVIVGKLPLVSQLLRAGGNAASADQQRVTPLHLAAGHGDATSRLLSMPGGLSLPLESNAMQCAFDFVEEEVVEKEKVALGSEANTARDYLAIASELLANGAQVNAATRGGVTAMHLAAARGDNEIVQLLLDHHAMIDPLLAGLNASPALVAADNKHMHTLQLLLNIGARKSIRDSYGRGLAALLKSHNGIKAR